MLTECIQSIIASITNLAGNLVTNVGSIITAPVIGVYSISDQAAIFNAFSQVRFMSCSKRRRRTKILAASNSQSRNSSSIPTLRSSTRLLAPTASLPTLSSVAPLVSF